MDHDHDAAIRDTVAAAQQHQNDLEPLLALHTPDALIVNIAGRRVLGRDAMRQAMEAALSTPLAQVRTKSEIDDIRYVHPDVAIVSLTKQVFDERDDGDRDPDGAFPTTGRLTYVMVRDDDTGSWRIASAQTTPVAT